MDQTIFLDLTKKGRLTAEKIIQVGEKQFIEHGYVDTSVAKIIEEAEITRSNFYRYFKDKNHLLSTILSGPNEAILAAISLDESLPAWGYAQIEKIIRSYITGYRKHRRLMHAMHEASLTGTPEVRDYWAGWRFKFFMSNRRWVSLAPLTPKMTNDEIDLLTEAIGTMVEGVTQRRIGRPLEEPSDAEIEEMIEILTKTTMRMMGLEVK